MATETAERGEDRGVVYWRCDECRTTNEDPHGRECEAWTPETERPEGMADLADFMDDGGLF